MTVELLKDVFWVGVVDWDLRHFHGHELSTHRGSTYNSYLIRDQKIALVDTVWAPFRDEFLQNLRQVVDPARIDYVIANHAEPDHSSSLPALMQLCPNATVVVSKRGAESIPGHYHQPWKFQPVKTGDRISLGGCELVFVEAPMLHWPDSMFTYVAGKNLLLPNDAFGQHYATAFRTNDRVDAQELYQEALKYYANILTPFSDQVLKKIDELLALKLPVDMIGPSHGVIWGRDPLQIVHKYREWAQQAPEPRAVIVYDTMWDATRRMAEAVSEGLAAEGVGAKLLRSSVTDRNDLVTEIFKARAVLLGSCTVNGGILATLMPILEDLRGLKFKNKIGAAFGSFGWSGEAVKLLEEHLTRCRIPLVAPGVKVKWQPTPADLEACRKLGGEVARAIRTDPAVPAKPA
jgi:flavorubredoxin